LFDSSTYVRTTIHQPSNPWELLIGSLGFVFIYAATVWKKTKPKGTRVDKCVHSRLPDWLAIYSHHQGLTNGLGLKFLHATPSHTHTPHLLMSPQPNSNTHKHKQTPHPSIPSFSQFSVLRNVANLSPIIMMTLSTVWAWALVKYNDQRINVIKDLPSGFRTFDAWDLGMADLSTYVRVCAEMCVCVFVYKMGRCLKCNHSFTTN
jgi:MFS superfamily sulfate permease-like transporter